jgi:hypothetical protein
MKWLEDFKEMVDNNPEMSDGELFRAFPELQFNQDRLTWALVYWHDQVVVPEFMPAVRKETIWQRIKTYLWPKRK